ncbi:SGNH/GDSL hydrolase family protein [Marinilabilia sp.]|uniref:SGNH/GDSL hydrolase family protein n=1 Tax=Marinilabilia sp. TaxID=2021252 RepID=UPI0025C583A8|nr:SGNH/GDSL hydrolase family protein [Marinilabilia sp.]
MKQIFLIFLMSLSGLLIHAGNLVPANNEFIEYTGRIDFSNPESPQFSYSGVSIRACFEGSGISAVLEDEKGENRYNIILDGVVVNQVSTKQGKHTYLLAEGLEDTGHEIEIFKRTELIFGKTSFHGFELARDASLQPITNERPLFIEYIGNSITCGYGNEGVNGETFGPETENHYMTYAAITSRNFNARHMAVSKSGIGIYRNYDGPAEGNEDCMPNFYDRIFLYDETPKYDFAVQPDVVCINLGTNDFSTVGGDSALYVSNYLRLIETIQAKYNHPRIVCLLGSMMSGKVLDEVRGYVQFIARTANRKGMGPVTFFEMSAQTGDLGIGVDTHPTVAQHQKNAAELTAYLAELMDWEVVESRVASVH